MAKTLSNSQEKQQYEVLKECWIDGNRYQATQIVKLTIIQAKEWLDRKCIKLVKKWQNETPQGENSIPTTERKVVKTTTTQNNKPETAGGQSVAGDQKLEDK